MTNDKSYNGWTNYETWNVNLWTDDNPGLADTFREYAKEVSGNRYPVADIAEYMKEHFEENNPLSSEASVYSDLLSGALSEVNWREIAEFYFEEAKQELKEEEEETEEEEEETEEE